MWTPEKQREYNRTYYQVNRDELAEYNRRYALDHPEQKKAWSNKYARSHKDQTRAYRATLPNCYHTWTGIRQRCENPDCPLFERYGGKGIKVDPRWQSFDEFLSDMGDKPKGWDLHRIDRNGDYTRANCIWLSKSEHSKITRAGS